MPNTQSRAACVGGPVILAMAIAVAMLSAPGPRENVDFAKQHVFVLFDQDLGDTSSALILITINLRILRDRLEEVWLVPFDDAPVSDATLLDIIRNTSGTCTLTGDPVDPFTAGVSGGGRFNGALNKLVDLWAAFPAWTSQTDTVTPDFLVDARAIGEETVAVLSRLITYLHVLLVSAEKADYPSVVLSADAMIQFAAKILAMHNGHLAPHMSNVQGRGLSRAAMLHRLIFEAGREMSAA